MNSEATQNSVPLHNAISPSLYASIIFCSLGLFIAFYVFFIKLGFVDKKRLQTDYHYRVRWIQTFILIINRLCDVIKAAIATVTDRWPGRRLGMPWAQYDEELKKFIRLGLKFHLVSTVTTYIIMLLVYFLTVDRYQRVALVLPQTKIARFLKATQIIYTLCIVYISAIFIAEYTLSFLGNGLLQKVNADMRHLVSIRRLVELFFISTGIILDYAITIRLIIISTHTNHPASLVKNEEEPPADVHLAGSAVVRKQLYRRKLAARMILLLAAMALIDVSMFTGQIIVNVGTYPLTETEMESWLSIFQSWISLRILLVYLLLDLFLSGLKQTARLAQVEYRRSANLQKRLQRFLDSLYDKTISRQTSSSNDNSDITECIPIGTSDESSKRAVSFSPVRQRLHHESILSEETTENPSYSVYKEHVSDMS